MWTLKQKIVYGRGSPNKNCSIFIIGFEVGKGSILQLTVH